MRVDVPRGPAVQVALDGIDELRVGRGATPVLERGTVGGVTTWRLPDSWMSNHHFSLVRSARAWTIVDASSKNGTFVDGHKRRRLPLRDGAVVDAGQCLFVFRTGVLVPARRTGAFISINCAHLSRTALATQLFGGPQGTPVGTALGTGLLASARGGTLFFADIAALSTDAQCALVRMIDDMYGAQPAYAPSVDVGVVASARDNLHKLAGRGVVRQELAERFEAHELELAPLRARREDLGLLIGALLPDNAPPLTLKAARALFLHSWRLNLRELSHVLHATCAAASREVREIDVRRRLGPEAPSTTTEPANRGARVRAQPVHREELVALCKTCQGNLAAVARALYTSRSQVRRLLRRFALDASDFRGSGYRDG